MVAIAGACALLLAARRDRAASPALPARDAGANTRAVASTVGAQLRRAPAREPALPAAPPATIRIAVDGGDRAIDGAELASRATALTARDRRAWRLSELLPDGYHQSSAKIHALTIDGGDYILRGDGRQGDDVIVVRRSTGELYLSWLDGDPRAERPLADAERPAERIEHVTRIAVTGPTPEVALPPAQVRVVVDGVPRPPLTIDRFAAAARLAIQDQRGAGAAPALDLAHAFGATLQVVALVSDGVPLAAAPPAGDARAVLFVNRRGRFKFAWIDPTGQPIGKAAREVSEIALVGAPRIAAAAPR